MGISTYAQRIIDEKDAEIERLRGAVEYAMQMFSSKRPPDPDLVFAALQQALEPSTCGDEK